MGTSAPVGLVTAKTNQMVIMDHAVLRCIASALVIQAILIHVKGKGKGFVSQVVPMVLGGVRPGVQIRQHVVPNSIIYHLIFSHLY